MSAILDTTALDPRYQKRHVKCGRCGHQPRFPIDWPALPTMNNRPKCLNCGSPHTHPVDAAAGPQPAGLPEISTADAHKN